MKKIVVLIISCLAITLTSCTDKIVVNNAFVYLVDDSCFNFGTIEGEQWQSVLVDSYSTEVRAIPKKGYKFVSWSDGNVSETRSDLATNDNNYGPVVYYAYFEVDND